MGFRKPDLTNAYSDIRKCMVEIASPYNDGFTSLYCKQELYQLKCWLNDTYEELPYFAEEEEWERNRIVKILKK